MPRWLVEVTLIQVCIYLTTLSPTRRSGAQTNVCVAVMCSGLKIKSLAVKRSFCVQVWEKLEMSRNNVHQCVGGWWDVA